MPLSGGRPRSSLSVRVTIGQLSGFDWLGLAEASPSYATFWYLEYADRCTNLSQ
jgi:hypothetical protein